MKQLNKATSSMLGFIPAIVVQHILDKKSRGSPLVVPEKQSFRSVVMFADISGFTNLTEQLSQIGPEGSEVIAFAINRYMELLVKSISQSGGDIFKFAGDAMIVVWPPPVGGAQAEEGIKIMLRQGIQSALDIQGKLNDTFILEGIKLSVKIGFGVGDISIIYVGGVFNRSEYLATGQPLIQAFESEHCATMGGQTIISQDVYNLVGRYFQCLPVEGHDNHYFVNGSKGDKVQNISNALMIKNNITPSQFETIKGELLKYIPAAIMKFIEVDQEKWSSELRKLTVMFVNLGIDLNDAKSEQGLQQIQLVIETVQKCIYSYQGSLNKLLMDDKGSTLIVVFGLPPMSQQDDPVKAIMTAQTMMEELQKINCKCRIGIATGNVFAGVVGTSGSRREYSVIGDSVNLSARLMQAACTDPKEHIIVDQSTANEASHKVNMSFYKTIQVKGKSIDIPIFIPIQQKVGSLYIHNPFYPLTQAYYVDRPIQQQRLLITMSSYIAQPNKHFIQIKGTYGIGKSLLMKQTIGMLNKSTSQYKKMKYGEKLHIISTSIDSFQLQDKYCGLKSILQQMLRIIVGRKNIQYSVDALIEMILPIGNEEDWRLFIDLFDFNSPSRITILRKQNDDYNSLSKIKLMILQLVAIICECKVDKLDGIQQQQFTGTHAAPVIVIIDDAQNIDKYTYKILRSVLKHIPKIMLIFITRDEYMEQSTKLLQQQQQREIMNDGVFHIESTLEEDQITRINIGGLDKEQLMRIVSRQFHINSFQYESNNTQIINDTTVTPIQTYHSLYYDLSKTHQNQGVVDINQLMMHFMFIKTKGNPLTFIHLLTTLIKQQLIIVNNNIAMMTHKLMNVIVLQETFTIDAPLDRLRVNSPILDKLDCIEQLVLKIASTIGDIFDIQLLEHIYPFKDVIPMDKLLKTLEMLENENILEVMEVNNLNKYYRFTDPFMREIIYQRLIFNYRRELHQLVAQAIQQIPSQYPQHETIEALKLENHWTLAEQKWSLSKLVQQQQLSHKAKRSVIIKTIQQKIQSNNKSIIIKAGILEKKSDANVTWAQRYCVMTQTEFRYYYTQQDFIDARDLPLGRLPLNYIYSIVPLNEKEKGNKNYAFELRVTQWIKKQKNMPRREFYFAAINDTSMEEWTIYLEFIRAKAIYDEFVNNFGKIQFPITSYIDHYNMKLAFEINRQSQAQTRQEITKNVSPYRNNRNTIQSVGKLLRKQSSESQQLQNNDKTQERVKAFISKSLLLIYSHLFQAAIQSADKRMEIGQNTKAFKQYYHLFKLEQSLFNDSSSSPVRSRKRLSDFQESPIRQRISLQVANLAAIKEEETTFKGRNSQDTLGAYRENFNFHSEQTAQIKGESEQDLISPDNYQMIMPTDYPIAIAQLQDDKATTKNNIIMTNTLRTSIQFVERSSQLNESQQTIVNRKNSVSKYQHISQCSDQVITNLKFDSKNNQIKLLNKVEKPQSRNIVHFAVCIKYTISISNPKQTLIKGQRVQLVRQNKTQTDVLINGQVCTFNSIDFIIITDSKQ